MDFDIDRDREEGLIMPDPEWERYSQTATNLFARSLRDLVKEGWSYQIQVDAGKGNSEETSSRELVR